MNESGAGSAPLQPLTDDDPAQIGQYRLRARIGSGGMGQVYLAYSPGGRAVAVKVVRQELAEDENFRGRFRQEVRAAARVEGLFTAPVLDSDTEAARPWLVTAYVPGPSLADAVERYGTLPVESVLLLVAGIAEALQSVHGAGLVHRDLKPSNVLLAGDGPRVIDFGIARAVEATGLTVSGYVVGTPSFMSPEQAGGGREVGPESDIFTLGQIAAYAATGAPAFGEGSAQALLYRVVHEEPRLDGVPSPLRELVAHCLAKEPAARPTLAAILTACRAAVDARALRSPQEWLPPALASTVPPVPTPPAPAPAPSPVPESSVPESPVPLSSPVVSDVSDVSGAATAVPGRSGRRRGVLLAVCVCAALALAGGGGYLLARGDHTDDRSGAGQPQPDDGTGDDRGDSPAPEPTEPEPSREGTVRLPRGWHVNVDQDALKPVRSGAWNKDEIDFRYHDGRLRTRDGNRLALLAAHREGSSAVCRKQVEFTKNIELKGIGPGRQLCLFTQDGHTALITLRAPAPAEHATFTITVWRDTAPTG